MEKITLLVLRKIQKKCVMDSILETFHVTAGGLGYESHSATSNSVVEGNAHIRSRVTNNGKAQYYKSPRTLWM
jgi:hypothetical protein